MCLRRDSELPTIENALILQKGIYFVDDLEQVHFYAWLQFSSSSRGCKLSIYDTSFLLLAQRVLALSMWCHLECEEEEGVRFVLDNFQ
jgi:hypothetical protein